MARPYIICAVLWAVLMFLGATAKSQPAVCLLFPQEDKVIHFVEYAIFAFILYRVFIHSSKTRVITMAAAYTAIIAVGYGGALELYQAFLPWRDCNALDFMANCAGVAFTLGLCWRPRG
jgi:VanZ family protein